MSSNDDDPPEDSNAPGESTSFRINPEALKGVAPLPGLDDIEFSVDQRPSTWERWKEGLLIHVVGSGIVAVLAFGAGLMSADTIAKVEESPKQPACGITATVSPPEHSAK